MLLAQPRIFIDEAHDVLRARGVTVSKRIDGMTPFPDGLLANHPLASDDPYLVPPAHLKSKISDHRAILSTIRERKFLMNRIVVLNGQYMFRTQAIGFTEWLFATIDPVYDSFGRKLLRNYKRLKNG